MTNWPGFRTNLLRADGEHAERVSFLELFFDLVFVFAITEVSHTLVYSINKGNSLEGGLQATVILLAVWWVWVYTAWVTNWLDPDKPAVRWMLILLLVVGLLFSTSIPEAFGDRALIFVTAYVVMQVGRAIFTVLTMVKFEPANALNITRLTIWFMVSAIFWFAGALTADLTLRLVLWTIAIGIEYLGPVSRYWVPGLRSSYIGGIPIRGGHIAERAGLFVIIAIGESVLVTGTAYAGNPIDGPNTLAFFGSITGSILLWLIYFSRAESGGRRFITRHSNPSLVAANSYTYLHVILVFGIVLQAVADELVLAEPLAQSSTLIIVLIYGAPVVYLVGNLVFKRSIGAPWLVSHIAGAIALSLLGVFGLIAGLAPLAHMWISNVVLIAVVIGEELDFRRTQRRRFASVSAGAVEPAGTAGAVQTA
jgi:low temperature requirement protein LtrA